MKLFRKTGPVALFMLALACGYSSQTLAAEAAKASVDPKKQSEQMVQEGSTLAFAASAAKV